MIALFLKKIERFLFKYSPIAQKSIFSKSRTYFSSYKPVDLREFLSIF